MNCLLRNFKTVAISGVATVMALQSVPVLAQSTEQSGDGGRMQLEEVIVTARRREESLMEVPTAVTAFEFDEMDRRGFLNLESIADFTPGMQYNNQGGQLPGRYNEAVRFRGMDTNQSAPSQQIGSVFVDGVYFPGGLQGLDFSQAERVEVIKGPQSATYGRSTFAGAVNVVMRLPGNEFSGRAVASGGSYGKYETSVSYEGPILEDKLLFRVSARQYGTNGQYKSAEDGGRLGEERTRTFQATLFAQPSENFSARLRWMFSQDQDGPPAAAFFGGPGSLAGTGGANAGTNCFEVRPEERANGAVADYYCGELPRDIDIEDFITLNTTVTPFAREAFGKDTYTPIATGITLPKVPGVPNVNEPGLKRQMQHWVMNLDYSLDNAGFFDDFLLQSLTGYGDTRASWVRDTDLTGFDSSMSQDPYKYQFWSQEFRISSPGEDRLRWSLGYSYFTVDYIRHGSLGMSVSGLDAACTIVRGVCIPPPTIGGFTDFPQEGGETNGIFGTVAFDFTPKLTLDVEMRYQADEITQDDRRVPGIEFADTFYALLPRVTLSYRPVDNSTVYATYSEGNLPGFFNNEITVLTPNELAQVRALLGDDISIFNQEETLKNHEIGWKQTLFGGRAHFAAALYKMDWTNLKTRQSAPIILDNGTQRALNVQFNAGDAEITGFELEGGFSVGENFSGQFTFEKVDAEYGTLQCSFSPFQRPQFAGNTFGPRDCAGATPARYPDQTASFGLNWLDDFGSSDIWDYFLRFDGVYFGKAWSEEANFGWYGKFWRFNLRGGFEKDKVRIELFAENLFNDDHYLAGARWSDFSTGINFGFLTNQGIAITPAYKRTIGLKGVFEF